MLAKFFYAGLVFMGFFALLNPISAMAIFLTLTEGEVEEDVRKIAKQSLLTAFIIVFVFSLAGNFVLYIFGISMTALRLTGGIVVGLIGYEMLHGRHSLVSRPTTENIESAISEKNSIAVTPLGTPLIAGPAVIITAMNFSAGEIGNFFATIFAFGILCLIIYYVFLSGKQIKKILGNSALRVITKMMGLMLLVIGMQMFIDGVYSAITDFQTYKYF